MMALTDRDSADQESAIEFFALYIALARLHTTNFITKNASEKDLSCAVEFAMAPYTAKIKKALVANLMTKSAKMRLNAAAVLLALDSSDVEANKTLQAGVASANQEIMTRINLISAWATGPSPQAVDNLGQMLSHHDKSVREAAAGAIIQMGTSARDLAPALIKLLETGKDAEGQYIYELGIALPRTGNLALVALEKLKEHAKPAVPAILKRYATANDEEQILMLACLANVGEKDDASLALMRKARQSEKANVQLAAACALLRLAPDDRQAMDLMKKALADDGNRELALETCRRFAPPSREIVLCLLPMLDSKTEDIRISATLALGRIGPFATESVPAIEKLLARQEDGMLHTFQSTEAAAYALAHIRGKEAAAALLRVADSKQSGALYAMKYLPELGDDLPPETLAVLVRAIQKKNGPRDFAAIALCNLGERARPVRREMERLLDDPVVGWILDTALRRMPEQD